MLSWMFRPQCAACEASSLAPLCETCARSLVELDPDRVVTAAPLARVVAPWQFGGQLASAIRRLKFTGASHVARTLAPLWAPLLGAVAAASDGVVVPVPLHWRRRWHRGYDQAWLLARHACHAAGLAAPIAALVRVRAAPAQSTLPASRRGENVAGAFAVRRRVSVAGRAVVLVDDVVTTGATMAAAAGALLAAGATRVVGVAVARAE